MIFTVAPFSSPFIRHRRRSNPKPESGACFTHIKIKATTFQLLLFVVVEATGLEPAASCSQSRHSTKLSYASIIYIFIFRVYVLISLLCPKQAYSCGTQNSLRLGAPMNFDRCAILALLYPPLAALRRRCPARGFGVVTFG